MSKESKFESTARESAELSNQENGSQLAFIYRTVVKIGPATFDELWSELYRKFQSSKAPLEKQKINVRTYLTRLTKAGLLKRIKEESKAAKKLKAAKKPRKARKAKPETAPAEAAA